MRFRHAFGLDLLLVSALAGIMPAGNRVRAAEGEDRAAALLSRLRESGIAVRCEAYEGLPPEALAADLERLASTVRDVCSREGARPTVRSRYVLLNDRFDREHYDSKAALAVKKRLQPELRAMISLLYPQNPALSRRVGEEPLPVVLVPRRERLDRALQSFRKGLPDEASPSKSEVPNAGTLWFLAFESDVLDHLPCPTPGPLPGHPWSPATNRKGHVATFVSPAAQGRVVSQGPLLDQAAKRIGDAKGAKILGRADTHRPRPGVWFVRYRIGAGPPLWTWAVPVADANGAARWSRTGPTFSAMAYRNQQAVVPEFGSRYENRVGGISWKKLDRHNLLVLPLPRPVGSYELERKKDGIALLPIEERSRHRPHERFTVNRELLEKHPVLILRKAKTWAPFMEDVNLDDRLSFRGEDEDSARALILSSDSGDAEFRAAVHAFFGLGDR